MDKYSKRKRESTEIFGCESRHKTDEENRKLRAVLEDVRREKRSYEKIVRRNKQVIAYLRKGKERAELDNSVMRKRIIDTARALGIKLTNVGEREKAFDQIMYESMQKIVENEASLRRENMDLKDKIGYVKLCSEEGIDARIEHLEEQNKQKSKDIEMLHFSLKRERQEATDKEMIYEENLNKLKERIKRLEYTLKEENSVMRTIKKMSRSSCVRFRKSHTIDDVENLKKDLARMDICAKELSQEVLEKRRLEDGDQFTDDIEALSDGSRNDTTSSDDNMTDITTPVKEINCDLTRKSSTTIFNVKSFHIQTFMGNQEDK